MPFDDPVVLFQLFHPLLLVPVLIWIGYRYLPVIRGAGRARVYLLMALCAGALAVQVGGVQRQAYPLVTWSMYSAPDPPRVAWRFVGTRVDGEEPFAFRRVVSTRSHRAFARNVTLLALEAERAAESGGESGGCAPAGNLEPGGARFDAAEDPACTELASLLAELLRLHNAHPRADALTGILMERCLVDVRRLERGEPVECTTFISVGVARAPGEGGATDAP